MFKVNGKLVKVGGKMVRNENGTIINLVVQGTCFPDAYQSGGGGVQVNIMGVSSSNKMYADFNDGTGIHVYTTNWFNLANGNYFFQDLADPSKIGTIDKNYAQQRQVKIWFDYPNQITSITFQNTDIYGTFPKNLSNYNLTLLRMSGVNKLTGFPLDFRGGVYNELAFNSISASRLMQFPSGIGTSRITSLTLQNVFNFSGLPSSTNVGLISGVQGLKVLRLVSAMMGNNSFPDTLKDITTLEDLYIGGNTFTTLPTEITNCAQLKRLYLGNSDGYGYLDNFSSWGNGLGLMTNLNTITSVGTSNSFPLTIPTGLANCVLLKTWTLRISLGNTSAKVDSWVNNFYDFVFANASTTAGNTKFRQMIIDIGTSIGSTNCVRPSGTYQDSTTPSTPMEKIYKLVKVYAHTFTVRNSSNTGVEVLTP